MKHEKKMFFQRDVVTVTFLITVIMTTTFLISPADGAFSIDSGNTLTYELTQVDIPFDQLSNSSGLAVLRGLTSSELVGSKLIVKILRVNPMVGWYTVGFAGILGQSASINFQELIDLESSPFPFGLNATSLTLENGASFLFTDDEIRMWSFFDFDTGKSGLFYLDSDRWSDHETALEAEFGSNVTVTNGASEFTVVLQENTNSTELVWFKTGENAGFLKSFEWQASLLLDNGTTVMATVAFSFVTKSMAVLPEVTTVAFELTNGDFDYAATGDYQKDFGNLLSQVKTFVTTWEGKEPIKYEIGTKRGVFYDADVFAPLNLGDSSSGIFKIMTVTYNGFDGQVYSWDLDDDLFRPATTGGIEIVPGMMLTFPAPIVTPDWEVREGGIKLARGILASFDAIVANTGGNLESVGLPGVLVSQYEQDVEFTSSDGLTHSIATITIEFLVNGTEYYASIGNGTLEGQGSLDVTLDLSAWQAFSDDGIMAVLSVNASLSIHSTSFGYFNATSGDRSVTGGQLDLNSNVTFKNTNFEQFVQPSENELLPTSPEGQPSTSTPGFDLLFASLTILLGGTYLLVKRPRKKRTR